MKKISFQGDFWRKSEDPQKHVLIEDLHENQRNCSKILVDSRDSPRSNLLCWLSPPSASSSGRANGSKRKRANWRTAPEEIWSLAPLVLHPSNTSTSVTSFCQKRFQEPPLLVLNSPKPMDGRAKGWTRCGLKPPKLLLCKLTKKDPRKPKKVLRKKF